MRLEGKQGRQGEFAFGHIAACGFSDVRIGGIIEDIVLYLEAEADDLTQAAHALHVGIVGIHGNGPEHGGFDKERCRFQAYDIVISFF